ncbi:MAG: SEL1-like repeat protein [Brevundimonas sp.]
MSAAAPWSVKGIEPKAREIAKDLARRSGMTLGEWLNTIIMEDGDDDEGVVPLSRRAHAADSYERRGRSRRMDDAYGGNDNQLDRLGASIDAIAARLEAAERRSTIAIQGVDQAVSGLVRRLDSQDQSDKSHDRRIDDIAEELREGHRRLRRFEQEVGPQTAETFGKVEATMGALAGRLYDIEERQRAGVNELRQRMDAVEKVAGPGVGADLLAQVGQRLDQAQGRTTEALRGLERSFAGLDQRLRAAEARGEPEGAREAARFEKLAETLSRQVEGNRAEMMRRLDTAETEGQIDRIERAVLAIGDQVRTSEERSAKAVEARGREVLRIAENLNGRVQSIETEDPARFEQLSRKVEADMGRFAQGVEQRLTATDDRHALALEKLGGEITRISDRLSERIAQSERRSQQALEDISRRLIDSSSRIEQHYDRASGELAERMRMSEERTAALIAEARDNIERRGEPARVVAAPAAEADWRAGAFPDVAFPNSPFSETVFDDPVYAEQQAWSADLAAPEPEPAAAADPILNADAIFDAVLRGPRVDPEPPASVASAPFGSRPAAPVETPAAPEVSAPPPVPAFTPPPYVAAPSAPAAAVASPPPAFGQGFGGADVSDALEATAPGAHDAGAFDAGHDDFAGETDFVDPRALRAAAAQGRASSTRHAIDAARAAMAAPAEEAPARSGFGLKKGGKSRLQERLDKQASRDGGTVRKALGASAIAVLLTAGGAYATGQLTGSGLTIPGLPDMAGETAQPIAALAVVPAAPTPADLERGGELYQEATALLDADDPAGIETLKQAALTGFTPAQLHLAGLYQDGGTGLDVNLAEARAWARRAAEGGDARGMHAYGMYLFDGVGGDLNRTEALDWLKRAAERGLVDSQYNVAKLYEVGDDGIASDPTEAYKWYLIAARAGDGDAQSAVERLRPTLAADDRGKARADADRFQVEPLA